jgi:hypothetical protein
MGSVSVASVRKRSVKIFATGLPSGGQVQVLRGKVDYAGTAAPTPAVTQVASFAAGAFSSGSVSLPVDTTTSCFVRVVVRNSTGAMVSVSNPIWLLRTRPPNGIPAARAC